MPFGHRSRIHPSKSHPQGRRGETLCPTALKATKSHPQGRRGETLYSTALKATYSLNSLRTTFSLSESSLPGRGRRLPPDDILLGQRSLLHETIPRHRKTNRESCNTSFPLFKSKQVPQRGPTEAASIYLGTKVSSTSQKTHVGFFGLSLIHI